MPLVPVLGAAEILAGIFALLILLSWRYWGQAVSNTLNFRVGVGAFSFNIFQPILDGLDFAYVGTLLVLDAIVHPVANFILAPIAAIEDVFFSIRDSIRSISNGLVYITEHVAPDILGFALTQIVTNAASLFTELQAGEMGTLAIVNQATSDLVGKISEGIGVADAYTDARIADLERTIGSVAVDTSQVASIATSAAIAEIDSYLPQISGLIQTGYADATAYADGIFHSVEQDIAGALSTAEAFTTTAINGVVGLSVTDIDGAITGALSGIYTDIDSAITDVVGVIGTDDADILSAVKAIPFAVPTDLAGLAALAGTSTLALTRYLRDCGIPNCQNLGQLGKDVQALLTMVGDASMIAFLVELIHDPSGARSTVESTFGTIIDDTMGAGKSLLGVL